MKIVSQPICNCKVFCKIGPCDLNGTSPTHKPARPNAIDPNDLDWLIQGLPETDPDRNPTSPEDNGLFHLVDW